MPKHTLRPQGDFPTAGLIRRLAAIFYDVLLCVALVMVVTLAYQQGILRMIHGGDTLRAMAEAGALDHDPVLASLALLSLFAFFAKFWTHNGQTLGMQAWGLFGQPRRPATQERPQEITNSRHEKAGSMNRFFLWI